tara:strand:- start:511 stop:1059 length:549 start_codon:yes stop_codon:yes gene_type:complete
MKVSNNSNTDRVGIQTVGMQFEEVGYVFREQPISGYGIDAQIEIVKNKNATGKLAALQIKSGISFFEEEIVEGFIYRGDTSHLKYWLNHSLPVLIVLCNTTNKESYWQAITPANAILTKKAWKIVIPKYQKINSGMNTDLMRLVSKLPVHKNYTIHSTKDLSLATVKRYSLRVILNREHTQL